MSIRRAILLFLFLPLIPTSAFFSLHGVVEVPPKPKFTFANVFSGVFQDGIEKDFARHFGFYAPLINLDNTLNYALRETNLNGNACVVIGRGGVTIAPDELAMHERDVFDWPKIEASIRDLAKAAEKLKKAGVRVVVLAVPAKLNYFPNIIPARWTLKPVEPRPYVAVTKRAVALMRELEIPVMDAGEVLDEIHRKTGALAYPLHGRHWTQLASCEILGRLTEPGFTCPPVLGDASDDELDHFRCLNAFFPFRGRDQIYHPGEMLRPPGQPLRALLVGSSFTRELEAEARRLGLFEDLHTFYYNQSDMVDEDSHPIEINEKWKTFVKSRDLIVIDFFEPQIDEISHGFAAQVVKEL